MRKQSLLVAVFVCLSFAACSTTGGTARLASAPMASAADDAATTLELPALVPPVKAAPSQLRSRVVHGELLEHRMPRPRPWPDPSSRADQVHPNRPVAASVGS